MKKFLYLAMCLLMVTSLCLCFVACGDDEEPTDSSIEPSGTSSSVSESKTDSQKPTPSTPSATDSSKPADSEATDSSIQTPDSTDKSDVPESTGSSEKVDSTESSTEKPDTDDTTVSSTGSSKDEPGDTTDSSTTPPSQEDHEHTYATVLSYDDKSHYYAATCEHTNEKKDVEEHTHDAVTGNCKCGHHVHIYSDKLSYDANNHFYKAICEHFNEVTGIEAHSFNEQNECKCGRVNDDLAAMLEELIKNKGNVTNGTSTQTNKNFFEGVEIVSGTTVTYIFYNDYAYVKEEGDYINEFYYSDNDGKLIAIQIQNGGKPFVDSEASVENLEGARYGFACFGDYETYVCGVERLVKYFYDNAVAVAPDSYEISKENNVYTLDYAFCVVQEDWVDYYYVVNMEFTVDESTTTLASANITVERYSEDNYTVVDGEYVLNEDAEYNYHTSYVVTQSTAANEEVDNPYDAEKILLDSIVIKDRDGNDIEEVVIEQRADEPVKLFLSDITPSTALLELCNIEVIVMNEADGTPININPEYNSYDNSYTFFVSIPGSYKVEFKIDDMTFTTTLSLQPKIPLAMGVQVYDFVLGEFNKTKKTEIYVDTELYITSYVDSGYDGEYIANIVSGNVDAATLIAGEIGGKTATIFKASAIGEYVIEIKSKHASGVAAQLRVIVTEAPTFEEILAGKYFEKDEHGKEIVNVEFDSYENIAYIVFMHPDYDYEPIDSTIRYTIADGKIEFVTEEDSEELIDDIYINEQYQLVVEILEDEYVLEKLVEEAELVSSGKMTVEDISVENGSEVEYAFELYSTGEFMFYKNYSKTKEVALSYRNGAYSLRRMGKETVTLVKINGDANTLDGVYSADGNVTVVITVDDEATYVKEPTFGTIKVVDYAYSSGSENSKHNFVYGYEIIDGEFVIYRYDVVTEDVQLIDLGGEYSFFYPGVASAQILEKVEGGDDVLGGQYTIEMNVGIIITVADIIITPGDIAPSRPIVIEKEYGAIYIEDHDGNATDLTGTYYYELVDGGFVIYKDGVITTDLIITAYPDGTYYFQCEGIVPLIMNKQDGVEGGLEGTYVVNGINDEGHAFNIFHISFVPGELEIEEDFGTLVIEDKNNGSIGGTYYYEIIDGGFVFYKEDGTKVTNEFFLTIGMDGVTYSFQATGFLIPRPLVKVEGMSVLFGGKYTVSGENGVAYEFTFAPGVGEKPISYIENGTLEIVDNDAATVGGSYTYAITEEGAIHIFKDGELTNDVAVSVGMNGGYIFKCAALQLPCELVKGKGEAGMLSGKYYAYNEGQAIYELLFLADGYEMPAATEQALVVGENTVVINDAIDGVIVTFTAEAFGNVTITDLTGNGIIVVYQVTQNGTNLIQLPNSFKLQAGTTVTLCIKTASNSIDTVKFNVEFKRNQDTELGDDEF